MDEPDLSLIEKYAEMREKAKECLLKSIEDEVFSENETFFTAINEVNNAELEEQIVDISECNDFITIIHNSPKIIKFERQNGNVFYNSTDNVNTSQFMNFFEEGVVLPLLENIKSINFKRIVNRIFKDIENNESTNSVKRNMNLYPHITRETPLTPPPYINNDCIFVPPIRKNIDIHHSEKVIKVEIKAIKFFVHQFSTLQYYLTQKIQQIFKIYEELDSMDNISFYDQLISVLRKKLCAQSNAYEEQLLIRILECHDLRDKEESRLKQCLDSIVSLYQMLKNERDNSYIETALSLKWFKQSINNDETIRQSCLYEEEIEKRAKEICRLEEIRGKSINLDDEMQRLRNYYSSIGIRLPGACKWKPRLLSMRTTPIERLPQNEVERRKRVVDTIINVKISVGRAKSFSPSFNLNEDFMCILNFGTAFSSSILPKYAKVTVYQNQNQKVCKIYLPLSKYETSSFDEYHFSSEISSENNMSTQGVVCGRAFVYKNDHIRSDPIKSNNIILNQHYHIPEIDPNNPLMIKNRQNFIESRKNSGESFSLDSNSVCFSQIPLFSSNDDSLILTKSFNDKFEKEISLDDVVKTVPLPKWCSIFDCFLSKSLPKVNGVLSKSISPKPQQLFVNLFYCKNFPIRSQYSLIPAHLKPQGYESSQNFNPSLTVSICIGMKKYWSSIIDPSIGRWNQLFAFDINDNSQTMKICIYDHFNHSFNNNNYNENHYLGTCEIKVASMLEQIIIDGKIHISVPLQVLGYNLPPLDFYLEMKIRFDTSPLFSSIPHETVFFKGVVDSPLSSLLESQNPPEGINNLFTSLRFVSMIPCISTNMNHVQDCQSIIDMNIGTPLEHAVLFANYSLHFGFDPIIIIASYYSYHQGAFVMITLNDDTVFFDPVSNRIYTPNQTPFTRVYYSFSKSIVRKSVNPKTINFDFSDENIWKIIHIEENENISQSQISYWPMDASYSNILEKRLNDEIKSSIESLLERQVKWNKSLRNGFTYLIQLCEDSCSQGSKPDSSGFYSDDSNLRVYGIPFEVIHNQKFDSYEDTVNQIIFRIIDIDLFSFTGDQISFGISIKVYPHPHSFHSIWVYIGAVQQLPKP